MQLKISLVAIFCVLIGILAHFALGYSEDAFHPKKRTLKKFTLKNKILSFQGGDIDNLSGNYRVELPETIVFNKDDVVHMSYDMNLGRMQRVNELYINDALVWDFNSEGSLTLLEVKN